MPRIERERVFWDDHVPTLEESLSQYREAVDPNTKLMFDSLEPLAGTDVLDFACGTGLTSLLLAERGAKVVGVDVSIRSIEHASRLAETLQLPARFLAASLPAQELDGMRFDRIAGRFALHHTDCRVMAPVLGQYLRNDGRAAFVETMDTNPVLRLARRHFVGRFGIPRYGTVDEHPLRPIDLAVLERELGEMRYDVARMMFLRIFDRQVLRQRVPLASQILGRLDDLLLAKFDLKSWSYQQVLLFQKDAT